MSLCGIWGLLVWRFRYQARARELVSWSIFTSLFDGYWSNGSFFTMCNSMLPESLQYADCCKTHIWPPEAILLTLTLLRVLGTQRQPLKIRCLSSHGAATPDIDAGHPGDPKIN